MRAAFRARRLRPEAGECRSKTFSGEGHEHELLDQLMSKMPEGAGPVLHSDMGWQYQQAGWCRRLNEAGVVQSMSRKGNCIDNGATEQVFGHIKDELFLGRKWHAVHIRGLAIIFVS